MNVNKSALPKAIRREFNRIYLEFRGGYNDTCTIIKTFEFLAKEHLKGKLFENEINEEVFVLLTDEKFTEYWKAYHEGFKKGYSEFDRFLTDLPFNDSDNKVKINRVFNGIYNKFNRLDPHLIQIENDGYLIIKLRLQEFGFEVGTFIKCWDIILNNHNLFENIFNDHFLKNKDQNTYHPQLKTGIKKGNYKTKHFVLAYIFDCIVTGKSFPVGQKQELEGIGNQLMGIGKGNTFYKNFNKIINKDFNSEKDLIEIGGENWKQIIMELSKNAESLKKHLLLKQL